MRYLLLLLFSPLCLFAVTCSITEDMAGEVTIVCVGDSGGGEGEPGILTESDCERIKSQVGSVLESAYSSVYDAAGMVNSIAQYDINPLMQDCNYIQSQAQSIYPQNNNTSNIIMRSVSMESDLFSLYNNCVGTAGVLYNYADEILSLQNDLGSYECSNQSCTGSGSGPVSCPCQEEFNRLLTAVNGISSQVSDLQELVSSNTIAVVGMKATIDIISQSLSSVTNRLNAPDDRMWGELEQIYATMTSNLNTIAKSSLDLQSIFYSIRQLLRGDTDGGRLNLTTEGLVSLVNTALSMQGNLQNQYNLSQIDTILQSYTNQVLKYFKLFSDVVSSSSVWGGGSVPSATSYDYIYYSMTNNHINARNRYLRLVASSYAGQTNWFKRMELYQQGLLGWFDTPLAETDFEQNQSQLTESSLELALNDTTNNLGQVVNVSSNLASFVSSSGDALRDAFTGSEINASIPSQLTILPQLTVMGEDFGPVVFDTSPYESTLDFVRDCTTLLWKFSFYVLVLLVIWITARKAYFLVLYIVHIMQNL